jgi:Probable zinc-ribbon domain
LKSGRRKREGRPAREALEAAITEGGAAIVDRSALTPTNSYGHDFELRGYYAPVPFVCKSCGKPEVWTPTQQKWWYEVAKGSPHAGPSRCRPCRAAERRRKAEAQRVHLEGLERKRKEKSG